MTGAGLEACGAAPAAAHPDAGLRDPRARRRRRGHGHREPQPARGQRLQGLPGRRHPDRAAGRRRDRGADRRRRGRGRRAPGSGGQGPRRGAWWTATSTRWRSSPRTAPATSTSSTPRCTGSAAPRSCRCWRPPASATPRVVAEQERARPRLPDGLVPQPRGARRDGPRAGAGRRHGADLVVANDPDADRCAAADRAGRTGGGCCTATRSGRCWPTTCSPAGARAPTPPASCRPRCSA